MAALAVATPILVIGPNFPEPVPVRPSIARWAIQRPAEADFGRAVRLAGYDAPASVTPGGTLALDLYWQILAPTTVDQSVFVHLTTVGVAGPPATEPRAVVYGGALKLAGVRLPAEARSGQPLEIDLEWESLAPVDRDYKVFVHLVDAADQPRAQSDGPLEIVD